MNKFSIGQIVKFKDTFMLNNPVYEKTFFIGTIVGITYNYDSPNTFTIQRLAYDLQTPTNIYEDITCVQPLSASEYCELLNNNPKYISISTARGRKSFMDEYIKRSLNSFYGATNSSAIKYPNLDCSLTADLLKKAIHANDVEHIYYNKAKGTTVVAFGDGTKIIKKLCEGDTFDLRTAVALAVAEKSYGSKTQFNKMINKFAVDQTPSKESLPKGEKGETSTNG